MTIARILILVIGLFSFPASADSRELDSLVHAIENVLQGRLTDADYRLQSLFPSHRGRAEAKYLERAHQVLLDYRVEARERQAAALDLLVRAIPMLAQDQESGAAESLLDVAKTLARAGRAEAAIPLVYEAYRRDQSPQLLALLDDLRDPGLPPSAKSARLLALAAPPPVARLPRVACTAHARAGESHSGGHRALGANESEAREAALRECHRYHEHCLVRHQCERS